MTRHSYSPQEISNLISGLTDRDRSIITILGDHGILTTNQIASVYFTSTKRAQARLLVLHQLDVLARFRRRLRYGSEPWHWSLAHTGARIHAAATGQTPPRPGVVADRLLSYAVSPQLPHRLGCNDFFIRILTAIRTRPECALTDWANETAASQLAGAQLRPDAAATYREGDRTVSFWLEHDRGTEPVATVAAKLERYQSVLRVGAPRPVLIELPSAAREANIQDVVAGRRYSYPIATTNTSAAVDPTAAVWHRMTTSDGMDTRRRRLIELGE